MFRIGLSVIFAIWAFASLWAGLGAVLAPRAPEQALAIVPSQPQALAAQLTAIRQDPSASINRGAQALLRAAPLSDLPLAYAGEAALSAGRPEDAAALLEAAIKRNPRREATRAWRAAAAVSQGETAQALTQLARLVVLDSARRETYLDAIAALTETPAGRDWLQSPIFANDQAAQVILRHLNGVHSDFSLLLALNQQDLSAQVGLVDRALRERGLSVAFVLWLSLLPPETNAAFSWPFNPNFEDRQAPPPFNWRAHGRLSLAEPGEGLRLSYTGRGRQPLISQLMLIRPGAYRLTSQLSGDGQERGGALVWEVSCYPSGAVLGRTARAGFQGGPREVEAVFEVPTSGCEGQMLTLVGSPGEFPMRTRARVTSVSLARVAS